MLLSGRQSENIEDRRYEDERQKKLKLLEHLKAMGYYPRAPHIPPNATLGDMPYTLPLLDEDEENKGKLGRELGVQSIGPWVDWKRYRGYM